MRLSTAALALLAALRVTAAQSVPDPLRDTLVALETKSWEAWQKRDGAFFQRFLSEDHVEAGFAGTAGKAAVVASVGSPACVVSSYTVDGFGMTRFDPNTALLSYHAVQRTLCGGAPVPSPVWVSSLYLRRDGRWQNALYQQTVDTRRRAAATSLADSLRAYAVRMGTMFHARDAEGVIALYADSARYVHIDNGIVSTRAQVVQRLRAGASSTAPNPVSFVGEPTVVLLGPDAAVVYYALRIDAVGGRPAREGIWTGALEREAGGWKIVHSHSSHHAVE